MATEIPPTPVIGEDEDYVWSLSGLSSEGIGKKATNEEIFHGLFLFINSRVRRRATRRKPEHKAISNSLAN